MGASITRIGWFDASRVTESAISSSDHFTSNPFISDYTISAIVACFGIIFIAFVIPLPGVRRQRCSSFLSFVFTLIIGALTLICIYHPGWHQAEVSTLAQVRRNLDSQNVAADLSVQIGLERASITLATSRTYRQSPLPVVHSAKRNFPFAFNYRCTLHFTKRKSLQKQYRNAVSKGLPTPVLTVLDFFSLNDGDIWIRHYRQAGYVAHYLLWLAFICWLIQLVMLVRMPKYFGRMMVVVGTFLSLADAAFFILIASAELPFKITFPAASDEGDAVMLEFRFGWCFYITCIAGLCSVTVGLVLVVLDVSSLYELDVFWLVSEDRSNDIRHTERVRAAEDDAELEFLPHPMMSTIIPLQRTLTQETIVF
uniref:Uncharacterized protein n=1 Tax=Plectus sambesii TaxID=2011161 RepID=A0A914VAE4_9BILA